MTLREHLSPVGNMHARGDTGVLDQAAALLRRRPDRRFLRRAGRLEELGTLSRDVDAVAPLASGARVLVLSLRYMPDHVAYEQVIAQALRLRGADVRLLTCGGGMPICEVGWARRGWPRPCDRCGWHTDQAISAAGLPAQRLADTLPWGRDARTAPTEPAGDPTTQRLADVSAPWFLRAADPASVPGSAPAIADFEVAVDGVRAAARRVLDAVRPDFVFMLNGLFAAERAVAEEARARGLRVATYEIAPRAGRLVFSQDAPAPEYDTGEAWEHARGLALDDAQAAALDVELLGRVAGRTSHERYFDAPEDDLAALRSELELSAETRIVSLFTNLSWDSACIGHDIAYTSMLDWMAGAVRAVAPLHDAALVIRVHPAEERWGTLERAEDGLRARVNELPGNVRIVGPAQPLSSYAIAELSDLVLTYTTTLGLESAVRGRRVAVAGETHYRGRGFTIDLDSHDDLVAALRAPSGPLPDEQCELARRYAFTFFFRTMLPLPPVEVQAGHVTRMPTRAAELVPGADPYVDFICDRLLDGGSFTLPDALVLPPTARPA
jgi:hypothetical protein